MPILSNPKHELFAQGLAKGLSADAAYADAGFSPSRSNAARLSANENIRNRVDELLAASAQKAGITIDRVRDEIAKVAFANMQDYVRITEEGDPYVFLADLTPEQFAAVGEVTVEDFKEGRGENARDIRRVKFKLHSKLDALDKLGKHLGMFREKIEHCGPGGGPLQVQRIERVIIDPKDDDESSD